MLNIGTETPNYWREPEVIDTLRRVIKADNFDQEYTPKGRLAQAIVLVADSRTKVWVSKLKELHTRRVAPDPQSKVGSVRAKILRKE